MSSYKKTPKPQRSDNLPEHLQGKPTSPLKSATKKPKLALKFLANVDEPFNTTNTPENTDSKNLFSPGHAPGYLQWRRALAPDLASETEEEKKQRLNKRHAPKGKRGTRCIDDGTIDRSPAILGKPDLSKLVVRFKTEETDECSNELIQGDIEFQYEDESKSIRVDWNDAKSLHALNNWRNQVIRRNIGKVYDNGNFWTVQEQKILTELVRSHLDSEKDIDWAQIASDYNSSIENIEQNKGTPGAPRRYRCQSSDQNPREAVCISVPLRENRQIPKRDDWVLRQEMGFFLAPDATSVMKLLRDSTLPQKNGHPPARTRREQSQLGKRIKDKVLTQESHDEQECSFASSTYEADRSMVEASPEFASTPILPLTQPRPLQPRQKAIVQNKAKPPHTRPRKRKIVYDKPSTDLHHYSTNFNESQETGDRRQALDLLAEQAAIMYDHLPEESKWSAHRPVVPTIAPAPTPAAAVPAPVRFRPVNFGSTASTRNTPVQMPTARMVPFSNSPIPTKPVPFASDLSATEENTAESSSHHMTLTQISDPSANPLNQIFTQTRPLVPHLPDCEVSRRMRETAGEEITEANAKKRSTSEPAPGI
ncbi:uncharacterized protein EAE97_011848 [Botrytis byssoidea]|uniref:Myb-like domain-containing protein n=1 Tax=Botrytis byssoidea TaxID=139641 RepID=A0A9P5HTF2_9HELO|nr:uncharacterized protein EAE97_011848 [Botrytis byssoidea]KAF7918753.1 hypothetical protein EAE97_011848 [Botrytis byssoidea]